MVVVYDELGMNWNREYGCRAGENLKIIVTNNRSLSKLDEIFRIELTIMIILIYEWRLVHDNIGTNSP